MKKFEDIRSRLEKQYEQAVYSTEGAWTKAELQDAYKNYCLKNPGAPRILRRAYLQKLIFMHAPTALEPDNPFAGKLNDFGLLNEDLQEHMREAWTREFGEYHGFVVNEMDRGVSYRVDMSHVSPDWNRLLELGFRGLRDRAAQGNTVFHRACVTVYDGAMALCRRLGLPELGERPPRTLLEAFQLSYLLHELIEIGGEEVRTMGHFDRQYIRFYRSDLAAGRLTREDAGELIKYFWIAFYARYQGKRFGKNFCFGPDFNELSYLAMEIYHEMNIVDPKLTVLVREDIPLDFLKLCARCIRDGRTGIVFLNDQVIIDGLIRHGREAEDARNYIPIGCYEPAVLGKEISISASTYLFLPVFVLRVLATHEDYRTFEEFKQAFLAEAARQTVYLTEQQRRCEKIWPEINPVPLLSGTFDDCVASGRDMTEGGAKYNTTGCVVANLGDAVDSLAAVEHLVYRQRLCTLEELRRALAADWRGHEKLRLTARNRAPKWGNNDEQADRIGVAIADFIGPFLSSLDNGRGGRMFPSLYGQQVVEYGREVGAFPSGRRAGEPLSKNLDAGIAMDKNGITALMNSVLKIDMRLYPCGSCLDLMLHPSAVAGDEGLPALVSVIRAFVSGGGSGLQFNVFDAETLREARLNPEKYATLQVRVCGWNVRFTDLSPTAQDTFITQAEALS